MTLSHKAAAIQTVLFPLKELPALLGRSAVAIQRPAV